MTERDKDEGAAEELRRTRRRLKDDELGAKYGWGSGDVEVDVPETDEDEEDEEPARDRKSTK